MEQLEVLQGLGGEQTSLCWGGLFLGFVRREGDQACFIQRGTVEGELSTNRCIQKRFRRKIIGGGKGQECAGRKTGARVGKENEKGVRRRGGEYFGLLS